MSVSEHIGENLKLERRIALVLFGAILLFMSVLSQISGVPVAPGEDVTVEVAE